MMEEICERGNLNRAYKRVKANKGAAGVDGMTVEDLFDWIAQNKDALRASLLNGQYHPKPVLGIEIPKPGNKGKRQLGIPTVIDRVIQQAIHQVLERYLEPTFSAFSFGFRPNKSAHQAIKQAQTFVFSGYTTVVDIDLCKFFDEVNHDVLMLRLQRRFQDRRLLKLIGRFLRADMIIDGIVMKRTKGMPQGSPLSPILSNLLLDDLDKELEKRGHHFCRFADDCNIYVRSQKAGKRVFATISAYLLKHLKLSINPDKSGVDEVRSRTFLGFGFSKKGDIKCSEESIKRFKTKLKSITRRNRGISLERLISELNMATRGWANYFKISDCHSNMGKLDGYIRRKLRCYRLKQVSRGYSMYRFLIKNGVDGFYARNMGRTGKGWWYLSNTKAARQAMNNQWFQNQGLLTFQYLLSR
jgi:RNA-directed DNA polymerase